MDAFDLPALLRFRERLGSLPDHPVIAPLGPVPPGRVAFLSGSFNPPTAAHLLLAERAIGEGFDAVVFVLPVSPAGKRPAGLCNEDRLMALHMVAEPRAVVAVTNAPLYVEQAQAACALTGAASVTLLAGSDKLVQIFEDGWYDDRDAALARLFACAEMLVSPRAGDSETLRSLIAEHDAYARRIQMLPLHPSVGELSSTHVRGLLAAGADPASLVPAAVASFCARIRAFSPPDPETGADPYALRVRVIELAATLGEDAAARVDLLATVRAATAATPAGARLRQALAAGDASALARPARV